MSPTIFLSPVPRPQFPSQFPYIWKIETTDEIDKRFLFHLLEADSAKIKSEGSGIAMMHATKGGMEVRKFPLAPLAAPS